MREAITKRLVALEAWHNRTKDGYQDSLSESLNAIRYEECLKRWDTGDFGFFGNKGNWVSRTVEEFLKGGVVSES